MDHTGVLTLPELCGKWITNIVLILYFFNKLIVRDTINYETILYKTSKHLNLLVEEETAIISWNKIELYLIFLEYFELVILVSN